MAKYDPEREAHKSWLGLLQPVGLVVSPPALVKAQVVLDRNVVPVQQALEAVLQRPASVYGDADPLLLDFARFAVEVLGWAPEDLAGAPEGPPLPERLSVVLPDYGETLRPSYAVLDGMADDAVLLLVSVVPPGALLDKPPAEGERHGWHASPQARLERLLRDTEVPAGLLCNGRELRLVYAPRGESSGHVGFPVAEMTTVHGRTILGALHMLLGEHRVFGAPDGQRLLDLLVESRKYQSEVSNRLAEQVLGALWELLRGFQAADEASGGRVLYDLARSEPVTIYGGLLTVIMRLVFLLYAEDQGLMPDDPIYARNYAIGGLYERLRGDAGRHPDTMDQRFGAWAWLLSTFRMVFDGGGHGGLRLPTRHGQLFNPDEFPFLEGRPSGVHRVMGETFEAPRVSDGVIHRVLEGLLVLDGERLSYRALDVEQIGSVYESMMGFDVQTLPGRAVAVRPKHAVIDLDALLAQQPGQRARWLKDLADCDLAGGAATALADASSVDDLVAALERRLSPQTRQPLPPGALFLQPGEERRRSGSHYTPRELTEPIVRTTLRPVLEALGERPTPELILGLKICDPAMGSGAFLVEACRQLAEALVAAWEAHGCMPALPPDEDPLLHARRLVAQRCLYGVDKNPFAVNLAKLSLWLVTLAKDHAFTFLDHALKHGDSLVGLTKAQIGAFRWNLEGRDWGPLFAGVQASVAEAGGWRQQIHSLGEGDYDQRREAWREAEEILRDARLIGDACIAAFFGAEKDRDRETLRQEYQRKVDAWKAGETGSLEVEGIVEELRGGERPVVPFHWEIEYPEVFDRTRSGFDSVFGNPPFVGGPQLSLFFGGAWYQEWLKQLYTKTVSNVDISAFFFRRAFSLVHPKGTIGLLATKSIAEGGNRTASLQPLIARGGTIYAATRLLRWPGEASVLVAVVHIASAQLRGLGPRVLDGRTVDAINSRLLPGAEVSDPVALSWNAARGFIGCDTRSSGFFLEQDEFVALYCDVRNRECLMPALGGVDVTTSPTCSGERYAVNFGSRTIEEAQEYPALLGLIRERVKPGRDRAKDHGPGAHGKKYWWQYTLRADPLYQAIAGLDRCLVTAISSTHLSFVFQPIRQVFTHSLAVFAFDDYASFACLQSRVHFSWASLLSSRFWLALRYSVGDGFHTFPFPVMCDRTAAIEHIGREYYHFRATLMIKNDEGLTKTYNHFHDPDERSPDILRLRELHVAMDRAVLDAYGWKDISTDCDFFLDYEIDEETWGDKKKPWRYRWPDEVHDEVLARLLDLNQRRYQEEVAAGLHDQGKPKAAPKPKAKPQPKAKKATRRGAKQAPAGPTLFNWKDGGDG